MLVLARVELIFFTVAIMCLFCICAENGTNIETFCYNIEIFVIAEQVLHRPKASSAFHMAMLGRTLGMHGRLGGDTGRTGDPS